MGNGEFLGTNHSQIGGKSSSVLFYKSVNIVNNII